MKLITVICDECGDNMKTFIEGDVLAWMVKHYDHIHDNEDWDSEIGEHFTKSTKEISNEEILQGPR